MDPAIGDLQSPTMPSRIIVLLCCVLLAATSALADSIVGRVVGITDGDTITVLMDRQQYRVRLVEIDTPEKGQPWGTKAKQALSEKVFGQEVEVRSEGVDRYGRALGRVFVDGRDVNREMVREGHAWVYRQYMKDETLLGDEAHARENRLGLWGLPEAQNVAPWEWRRGGRVAAAPAAPETMDGAEGFICAGKQYCRKMASCAEAMFYLRECGLTRLDGDGDDVPCEAMCR